ncbi:MAG: head maturation protease, ClpP-related [Clostridia bacterium]
MRSKWFAIMALADSAEVSIFDEIGGFGISVSEFKEAFDLIRDRKEITVYINSPGGSVTEGMALYNILASARDKITVEVIGLAASIASIVALAGKSLVMDEGTYFMIHNPWTITWGEADELRKTADVLDKMRGELINIYAARSGLSGEDVAQMMDDETWLTAEETKAKGFASSVRKTAKAAALSTFDISKIGFQHPPKAFAPKNKALDIKTIRDYEGFLRDAGFSKAEAEALASGGFRAVRRDAGQPRTDVGSVIAALHSAAKTLK